MPRVLISGGTGLIGSALTAALRAGAAAVYAAGGDVAAKMKHISTGGGAGARSLVIPAGEL